MPKALLKYGMFFHICDVEETTKSIKMPKPPERYYSMGFNPQLPNHIPTFLLFERTDEIDHFMGHDYIVFEFKGVF